jgi:hypothetical protein
MIASPAATDLRAASISACTLSGINASPVLACMRASNYADRLGVRRRRVRCAARRSGTRRRSRQHSAPDRAAGTCRPSPRRGLCPELCSCFTRPVRAVAPHGRWRPNRSRSLSHHRFRVRANALHSSSVGGAVSVRGLSNSVRRFSEVSSVPWGSSLSGRFPKARGCRLLAKIAIAKEVVPDGPLAICKDRPGRDRELVLARPTFPNRPGRQFPGVNAATTRAVRLPAVIGPSDAPECGLSFLIRHARHGAKEERPGGDRRKCCAMLPTFPLTIINNR